MHPLDRVWYAATWNKGMLPPNRQNIHTADDVTRGGDATAATAVYPPGLVPFPAYGTRLRGIMLVHGNGPTGLVSQLRDQSHVTRTADLLRLLGPQMLRRVIEGLPHIAHGARKRRHHCARGLVRQIPETAMRLREHPRFPTLQALPPARALRLCTLGLTTRCQAFVAILHGGLSRAATDQHGLCSIGGRQQGIDAQVNPYDDLLWHCYVRYLTDQTSGGHRQTDFDQASRQRDRQRNTQRATGAVG